MVDIGDHDTCRMYMQVVLKQHPSWPMRRVLEEKMGAATKTTTTTSPLDESEMTESPIEDTVSINITKIDWKTLLESLLLRYKEMTDDKR